MPDEKDKNPGDGDSPPDTPLHAYREGNEDEIEGSIPDGDEGAADVTPTGGATSGGPPTEAEDDPSEDAPSDNPDPSTEDDAQGQDTSG